MQKSRRHILIENSLYATLWLFVLAIIIFLSQNNDTMQWKKVLHDLIAISPFFAIFLINNIWFTPHLLFKKKYIWFFGLSALLILFISHPKITMFIHDLVNNPERLPLGPPPNRPDLPGGTLSPLGRPPRNVQQLQSPPAVIPIQKGHFVRYLNNMLLSVLVMGFNTGIKLAGRLIQEERLRHQVSEEKLQAELSFLKHQISPHFLMNTLNNIHALVELDPTDAQSSIVKLSHMLRYLLYEKEDKKTSLQKEVEFIKSYTTLMKLRYSEDLKVTLSFPEEIPVISIPPFVFITILENAFKHGAAIGKACYINLSITIEDEYLVVSTSNCKQENASLPKAESCGIGLENTRRRLDLYYGDRYIWEIKESERDYTSIIKLPVYDN